MNARCLGKISSYLSSGDVSLHLLVAKAESQDAKLSQDEIATNASGKSTYIQLGDKLYLPINDDGSLKDNVERCDVALNESQNKPVRVCEVSPLTFPTMKNTIFRNTINKVWIYKNKLYLLDRDNYTEEQVHLLILKTIDKENKEFAKLKKRYKT